MTFVAGLGLGLRRPLGLSFFSLGDAEGAAPLRLEGEDLEAELELEDREEPEDLDFREEASEESVLEMEPRDSDALRTSGSFFLLAAAVGAAGSTTCAALPSVFAAVAGFPGTSLVAAFDPSLLWRGLGEVLEKQTRRTKKRARKMKKSAMQNGELS